MKRLCAILVSLLLPLAAHCAEEDQLLDVLHSSQSLQEKDAACARLKWIGTARSVPALAELLTDDNLSHSARYALESMPGPEAEDALRQALAKTSGSNQVGIIHSLGFRADPVAVPDLAALAGKADVPVAAAAADALGHIGGSAAVTALESVWNQSEPGALHDAQTDGLLACANRLGTAGDLQPAAKIFQRIYDREKDGGIRLAAFRGLIMSSEKKGITLMVEAIEGPDGPNQGAALQLASKVGGVATTKALTKLLPTAPEAMQIALLQALAQRQDRSAVPMVAVMVGDKNPDVRLAAIAALGELRDGRVAVLLVHVAAKAADAEKSAAREALSDLFYGPVREYLLGAINDTNSGVPAEAIRALGARGDGSAAPKLLEVARADNGELRSAALQALALLAGPAQVPDLVQLVVSATNDDARSEAADALGSACQHIEAQRLQLDATPLAQAARTASLEARLALLGVCSGVSDAQIRETLRAAVADPDERVREAAFRALCNSQDEELLPDMLAAAQSSDNAKHRLLGLRGCVQLIEQEQTGLPAARKADTLKTLLAGSLDTEGKRLVLSALVTVPTLQTLDLASGLLDDAEVKAEAADATVQIARAVSRQHPVRARAALKKVLKETTDENIHKSAQAALNRIKTTD